MLDGVAKIPLHGGGVSFRFSTYLRYVFAPENHSAMLDEILLSHSIY